ncbi:MAG: 5-amino-6-(5-phosphoribosylamino)uracil reductase homolog [uncultured Nocardioidaceae bacterium]|uniref:5-amino-6-(5-phosphoribosylamino)uracil reductase homolog n=1 Tax=uncultured Nocardioidaceae bacterium TaxID=253824 RepID=A0A6J4NK30_9ACTN|nr:MAG: 5-amino-6-(5-phosphoribosylamino)uracil reductase homolog [uncultured Nocardioidaceae bacterium]
MRVLIDRLTGSAVDGELGDDQLRAVYAVPRLPWLRANMVQTVDGAATGANGRSGSINNAADKRVFDALRSLSDALVVGAGTARAEGYGPAAVPIVLVSRGGEVPPPLRDAPPGMVQMVTCAASPALGETRSVLGPEHVLVLGEDSVDLAGIRPALEERGFRSLLCEGGPQLLTGMLAAGAVDELCVTVVPGLLGGEHPRITSGAGVDQSLELGVLLEEDGTLLGRWLAP